jgi:hypothetical protein
LYYENSAKEGFIELKGFSNDIFTFSAKNVEFEII